jgi:putative methanogenesis marker protein 17
MEIEVTGPEKFGNDAYATLFKEIMSEAGKAVSLERARLSLDPAKPLFIFSIVMRAAPESKKVADVVSMRTEGKDVHLTISDENFAPEVLSVLWKEYGRDPVEQQSRFDLIIKNGDDDKIAAMEIASSEDAKQEIIGALWKVLPEGIKVRHNISEGRIITVAATEEILTPEILAAAEKMHAEVKGGADV